MLELLQNSQSVIFPKTGTHFLFPVVVSEQVSDNLLNYVIFFI